MPLADMVKELRQKLGWKQVTLAKESGVSQATISRIESGTITQPRMGELRKIANALGTTIDYLAGDSMRMSFEDGRRDKAAQVIFNGWRKLSAKGREELANFTRFLEEQEGKEE